ncbi:class I SAM-dependent methyltransferase [Nonomuraea rhizosphaerae]|uniref:class I SAM-dependent methyltransferase n=1 Tax=Nonomuraea rhizosphaerae TaxID=2665663 RepID=UPI001C5F45F7|nr:class I SAM-dependent methyltransferase [Nonomuraea rhizosphaerae]
MRTKRDMEKVRLTGAKGTLLYTLYFRALDSRSPRPILGDEWAPRILDRLDHNHLKVKMAAGDRYVGILRARRLDDWTGRYLAENPGATVLQLGCGLDSRAFRMDLPPGVEWIDLDYPEVIDLRSRLYPERDHYRMIPSSVTDPSWLEQVPTGRPVLVIAEGLLMYLTDPDVRQLLVRLAGRVPHGELAFDAISPWLAAVSRAFGWKLASIGDPREPERWAERLTLLECVPVLSDLQLIPAPHYRAAYGLLTRTARIRNAMRLFRFRVGDA